VCVIYSGYVGNDLLDVDSLTTFFATSSSIENSLSSSSANTTTISTSLTSVCRRTKLARAHGSNTVAISENIDESTFEDAFCATSEVATGRPLCDIFVQKGASQKKCTSQVAMKDYIIKLEIFPRSKIQYVQKKDWWKHASTRALETFSEGSPHYAEVMRVAGGILDYVFKQPNRKTESTSTGFFP
ncbi:Uncharacterized protein FWK35_00032917, partial [Aphis craccivora]